MTRKIKYKVIYTLNHWTISLQHHNITTQKLNVNKTEGLGSRVHVSLRLRNLIPLSYHFRSHAVNIQWTPGKWLLQTYKGSHWFRKYFCQMSGLAHFLESHVKVKDVTKYFVGNLAQFSLKITMSEKNSASYSHISIPHVAIYQAWYFWYKNVQ